MSLQPYTAGVSSSKSYEANNRLDIWTNQFNIPNSVRLVWGTTKYVPLTGSKVVSGHFKDEIGVGISRTGYAYDRVTGNLLASFVSDGTGAFTFNTPTVAPVIIVLVPNVGDSRNAIALDNIVPI